MVYRGLPAICAAIVNERLPAIELSCATYPELAQSEVERIQY